MVGLLCDSDLQPFYASLGMVPATGMMIRYYERQSGKEAESEETLRLNTDMIR